MGKAVEPNQLLQSVICKCGKENSPLKKTCESCGIILEGYTFNNVTGTFGYRGSDGLFYLSKEDYEKLIS